MASVDQPCGKRRFLEYLRRIRCRLTSPRRTLVEVVFNTRQHFTAEQLLAWSRRRDPTISRATVYRTLPLLTASGLVREVDFGGVCKSYDPNYADRPNHSHIICQDCGRIVEFENERIAAIEDEISRQHGFAMLGQRLQIVGACEELRIRGTCAKREEARHKAPSKAGGGRVARSSKHNAR